jgi:putative adhesin
MKRHILISAAILLLLPTLVFARVEGQFDRTLTVSGAVNLDLTTGSGEVLIKTGTANQVVIHGRVHSNDWWGGSPESAVRSVESNPPIQQNGNSIRIGYNLPEDVKRHVGIAYEITLPPDTTLAVNTGSGEISVEGVRASAKLHTGSGSIRARDLGPQSSMETGSGSIRAESVAAPSTASTGSGSIQADFTGSGDIDVHTGSGGIDVRGVNGGLRGRTGSGHINVDGNVKGAWQLHTGSGGVRLVLGSNGGFNLNVHTGSGSINSQLPITVQGTFGRRELRGVVRGGGPELEISTGSGDVEIR